MTNTCMSIEERLLLHDLQARVKGLEADVELLEEKVAALMAQTDAEKDILSFYQDEFDFSDGDGNDGND